MEIVKLITLLFKIDQAIRQNPKFSMEMIEKTDVYCTEVLKKVLEIHGIITISNTDELTAKRFVMLVQHSRDLEFAQSVCDTLQQQNISDVPKDMMPYLIDKLLVKSGKEQRFGTIVSTKFNENNEPYAQPKPIEDIENVDKRRAEYGLEPLEEYLKKTIEAFKKFSRDNYEI